MQRKKNILIYGAGSVGTFLGAKLHRAGHHVTMINSSKIRSIGQYIFINGESYEMPRRIDSPKESLRKHYDVLFVTSKLGGTRKILESLREGNITSTITSVIQNGMVDMDFYDGLAKRTELVRISIFEGFHLIENQITASKSATGWQMDPSEAGKKLSELLTHAQISAETNNNISVIRAEKMLMNCAVNALSAISNKTFGELVADEEKRILMEEVIEEGYAVLSDIFPLRPVDEFKSYFFDIIEQNKAHYSSLHQDLKLHRKTEINYLNGLLARMGTEKNIPTPINKILATEVEILEESIENMSQIFRR